MAGWDEGLHPRASNGEFGAGGGTSRTAAASAAVRAVQRSRLSSAKNYKPAPAKAVETTSKVADKPAESQSHQSESHRAAAESSAASKESLRKATEAESLARAHARDKDIAGAEHHAAQAKSHGDEAIKHSAAALAHAEKSGDAKLIDDAQFEHDEAGFSARSAILQAKNAVQMARDAERGFGQHAERPAPEQNGLSAVKYTQESISFERGLSDDQRFAIGNYSNHTDKILNASLRASKGDIDPKKDVYADLAQDPSSKLKRDPRQTTDTTVGRELHDLDSAIASHRVPVDTKVYRTMNDPGGKITGALTEGGSFTDHGYVSTTANRGMMDKFHHGEAADRVDMHITLREGTAAAPMGRISTFGGEEEMLLPRGTSFKVTKIVPATGTSPRQIHVEVTG